MNSTPLTKGQITVCLVIFFLLFLFLVWDNLPAQEQPHYPDRLIPSSQVMAALTPPDFKPELKEPAAITTAWLLPVDYEITAALDNPKELQSAFFGNFPEGPKHLLIGSLRILDAVNIVKPFKGVAISLENTQAPKAITERWQVVWYVAADGNTNRKLRQALADGSGAQSFSKSDAPWVVNIEPAGNGNRGVISVFSPAPIVHVGGMPILQTDLVQSKVDSLTSSFNHDAAEFQAEDATHQTQAQYSALQTQKQEINGLKQLIQVNQENL